MQAVGEAADDAGKMGELLVEIGAQPFEFGLFAEILGIDGLVEFDRVDAVVAGWRQVGKRQVGADRFARRLGVLGIGIGELVGFSFGRFGFALALLVGGRLIVALAALFAGRIVAVDVTFLALVARLVVVVLVVAGIVVAKFVAHVEGSDQVARRLGEFCLVDKVAVERGDGLGGLLLDEASPQIDETGGPSAAARRRSGARAPAVPRRLRAERRHGRARR